MKRGHLLPIAIAVLGFGVRFAVGPLTIDDAYITLRYARNIASGLGFVYNPGEHVLGTTTPLQTLLMAAAYRVGLHDLPWVALVVNALADGATAALLFGLAVRLGLRPCWALLVATLFALNPLSIGFAVSGMESSVFTLFVFTAIYATITQRAIVAGLAASLATLGRPEGLLLAGLILGGPLLLARRQPPARAVAALCVPLIGWVLHATWWFGSPLPQSLSAKAVVYKVSLAENAINLLIWSGPTCLVAIAAAVTLVRPAIGTLRARPELLALYAFAPLLLAAYFLAGVRGARIFPWYAVPLVPFILLITVVALSRLTCQMSSLTRLFVAVVLLAVPVAGFNLGRDPDRGALAPLVINITRERGYAAAARLVTPRLARDALVALPEIGIFGYVSGARILDLLGLVSPEAARFYPLPDGLSADNAIPADLIQQRRPEFIVSLDQFLQQELVMADWFRRDYLLVESFDSRIWGSQAVVVYERVGRR